MSLASLFIRDADQLPRNPFDSPLDEVTQAVEALLAENPLDGRVPVISHERLSGYPHSGGFDSKMIADHLKDCFPEARIWCVIREQKSMVASLYMHYLKNGGTDNLEKYLGRRYDGKRPGYSPEHIRYTPLVSYYQSQFGKSNVLVQPYELFREDPVAFMTELGDFLGVTVPTDELDFKVQRNRHEEYNIVRRAPALNMFCRQTSLSGHSPMYIPALNRFLRSRVFRRRRGLLNLGLSRDYSTRFKARVAELVGDRYGASNRELSSLIGTDLSRFGYHEPLSP